jgi:hypothetical protein
MENRAEGTKQGQGAREREPPPAAHGAAPAEQTAAADCLQRPLVPRSRCPPRLMPGFAMTSNVKRGLQLFYVCMIFLSSVHRKSRSQEDPTVDPAAIRGLATT